MRAAAGALALPLEYAAWQPLPADAPVVLSYGMGDDSTAVLLRWLTEPASRDFALDRLIVVTAMTGDEFPDTLDLVERHVLPRLRQAGVRFVQVARGGPSDGDGIAVLDDSRSPTTLHGAGPWRLSDELRAAGTVPQVAAGRRLCSVKFKGWVIDTFLARDLRGARFRHVIGFNAEERNRAERDRSYSTGSRESEYPLIGWAWDRAACERYVEALVGEPWPKSCCTYCPFASDHHADRYRQFPEAGVDAVALEDTSRALNPAMALFGRKTLRGELAAAGLGDILAAADARRATEPASLYDVRRIIRAAGGDPARKGPAWRSVRTLATGTPAEVLAALHARAEAASVPVTFSDDAWRLPLIRRGSTYPTREQFVVVGPAGVADKQRPRFEEWWRRLAWCSSVATASGF